MLSPCRGCLGADVQVRVLYRGGRCRYWWGESCRIVRSNCGAQCAGSNWLTHRRSARCTGCWNPQRAQSCFVDQAVSGCTLRAAIRFLLPPDEVIVCRCEEVRAGDIRRFAALGCSGPNRTKVFSRCGMAPCQGRNCGLLGTEILAAENGITQNEVGSFRIRAPLKPVTLGELASLADKDLG